MTKNKRTNKKNKVQYHQYKNYISSISGFSDSTVPSRNDMLMGSDELMDNKNEGELYRKEDVKITPFKYRVYDWIKKNILPTIITSIILGVITAMISSQVTIRDLSHRLDRVEKEIELIDVDDVEKDYLNLQLNLLKSEIENNHLMSLNELKLEIDKLEIRLSTIEKEQYQKTNK